MAVFCRTVRKIEAGLYIDVFSVMTQAANDTAAGNSPLVPLRSYTADSPGKSKESAAGALKKLVKNSSVAKVPGYGLLSIMHGFLS